jgi:hypothetical protein
LAATKMRRLDYPFRMIETQLIRAQGDINVRLCRYLLRFGEID